MRQRKDIKTNFKKPQQKTRKTPQQQHLFILNDCSEHTECLNIYSAKTSRYTKYNPTAIKFNKSGKQPVFNYHKVSLKSRANFSVRVPATVKHKQAAGAVQSSFCVPVTELRGGQTDHSVAERHRWTRRRELSDSVFNNGAFSVAEVVAATGSQCCWLRRYKLCALPWAQFSARHTVLGKTPEVVKSCHSCRCTRCHRSLKFKPGDRLRDDLCLAGGPISPSLIWQLQLVFLF